MGRSCNPSEELHCVVPEKIHTHLMEGHWKFLGGGGGVSKAKFLEEMYESKLEFPEGRGCKTKSLPWGVWIFSGTAHLLKTTPTMTYAHQIVVLVNSPLL